MELHEKANVLRQQLGYDQAMELHKVADTAVGDLGLEGEAKGMNLPQKVDMCLGALGGGPGGSGSSSAAAVPTAAVSNWWGDAPVAHVMQQSLPMGVAINVEAVQPQVVAPMPMVMEAVSFVPVHEYDEVWNDRGSGARQDVSVWKARVPPGCFSLGMTAQRGYSMPTFPALVARAGGNQIAPPDRYELAWWQERGQRRFWCWHPVPPPGYASLGDVGTLSAEPPSREEVVCVAIASLPGARQPLGNQIWNDRGGGAPKDAAFWAQPGNTGLFRCNDDATHRRPAGDFYLPPREVEAVQIPMPSSVQMARGAADEFAGKISARELAGCWVGFALCLPWLASLEPIDDDAYAHGFQCCLPILLLCGRQYRRTPGTNTFHWHVNGMSKGNEDWENFTSDRCACMAPGEPPSGGACAVRIC